MAGNKNSGRKSRAQEAYEKLLRKKGVTVEDLLRMSRDIIQKFYEDPNIDIEKKADVAVKLVARSMPQAIVGDKERPVAVEIVNFGDVK